MIAAVGAALAVVLGFATFGGSALTALAVGLVQAVLLVGWLRAVPVPEPLFGVLLAAGAAATADALALARGGSHPVAPVALVLGPAVVASFLVQLARRAPRVGLTASLTSGALLMAVVVLAALYVSARRTHGGAPLVTAVAAGAVAAAVVALLPASWGRFSPAPAGGVEPARVARTSLEPVVRALAAGVLGAGAGALVGALTDLGAAAGTWLGATAGVVAGVGRVLALDAISAAGPVPVTGDVAPAGLPVPPDVLPAAPPVQSVDPGFAVLVGAALPVALAAPVSYVLGRILVG